MPIIDEVINTIKKQIAKMLLGKKYSDYVDMDVVYDPDEEIFLITLKRLVFENKINEAEEFLFDRAENNPTENLQYIAIEFYTMVMEKSDEELAEANFDRSEVTTGVIDFRETMGLA